MITESNKRIFISKEYEVRRGMPSLCIQLDHTVALTGDIRVDFFNRPKMKRKVSFFFFRMTAENFSFILFYFFFF